MKIVKDGSGETYTYSDDEKYWFSNYTPMPPVSTITRQMAYDVDKDIWLSSCIPTTQQTAYDINEDIMNKIFQEMAKRFNQVPLMEHKCNNCGAVISMDADRHLFTCGYCGSAYVVGTTQINS